jgi:hypothetical protein
LAVNDSIVRRGLISGKLARRGTNSKFSDLVVTSGQSDMQGTVSIESSSGRPKLDIDLNSNNLRMSDLGERAAGLISKPETSAPLLLSDAMLDPVMIRRGDAVGRGARGQAHCVYQARCEAGGASG